MPAQDSIKQLALQFEEEIWGSVPDYEGWYEASNFGKIRRIASGPHTHPGKLIKPLPDNRGYSMVHLSKNGVVRKFMVHHLVLKTFTGERNGELQANHKDGTKSNNRLENLEWCSPDENISHGVKMGLFAVGERNHKAKLTEESVIQIRKMTGSNKSVAKDFGVAPVTVSHVRNRRTWKHVR